MITPFKVNSRHLLEIEGKPMRRFDLGMVKHVHLVGVGGSGMGGIAEVLLNQGYLVSGSDIHKNKVTQRLEALGATIYSAHDAKNLQDVDLVVFSSAIGKNNPELVTARELRLPILQRAQMLAELMRSFYGIAVAGTHGKTTTTSLIVSLLTEAKLDPTFVIGGLLKKAGSHAKLGTSRYFIAEADESDASFLCLHPHIAIVTNIDADHLATYQNDFNQLKATFIRFLAHLPFNGLAILCVDDPVVKEVLPSVNKPTLTYGFSENADIQIKNYKQYGVRCHFTLQYKDESVDIQLNLAGRHNAENAAASYAVAHALGICNEEIVSAFSHFAGVGRRFQLLGELPLKTGKALLIDDYGHHPREIAATIEAARAAWPNRRLVMAYQPHRYSRTQALWGDFISVLSSVDQLILLDIYSAGEEPIDNVSGEKLFEAVVQTKKMPATFIKNILEFSSQLPKLLQDGDVVLLQGAGNIGGLAAAIGAGCQ